MSDDMAELAEGVQRVTKLLAGLRTKQEETSRCLSRALERGVRLQAELDDVAHTLDAVEGEMVHKATSDLGQQIEELAEGGGILTRRTCALQAAAQVLANIAEQSLQGRLRGVEGGAVLWREALESIHASAAGAAATARQALKGKAE